jgi:hypothetical protein
LNVHEAIHAPSPHRLFYPAHEFHASTTAPASDTSQKISQVSASQRIVPSLAASNAKGKAGVEYSWDGNGDGKWTGYAEGEFSDNNGNSVRGRITQNSDGSGSATLEGESSR